MTALATVLLVNRSRRRLIGVRQRLGDTGADDRLVMVAIQGSTLLVATLSVVVGAVLGVLAGCAVRIAVLPHLLTQPMSPVPGLGPLVLGLWLVAMLTALAAVALRVRAPRPLIGIKPGSRRFQWPTLRRATALVAAAWSLQPLLSASDLDSVSRAALPMVTAVLLMVPDGFRLVVRGIPTHRSEWVSARRLIESDRARYSGAVVALAFSLAVPTILATLYATQWHAEDERNVSTVPAGQVHVSTGYLLDADTVRSVVAELHSATDLPDPVMIGRAESVYLRSPNQFGAFGLWVVQDASELETVLGQAWTQPAGDVLNAGGVVSWAGAAPPLVDDARGVELPTGPATTLDVDPGIASSAGGAILAQTARGLGIPVLADQLAVYNGVTDAARQEALAAVQAAGFTSKAVQYHTEPTPTEFPPHLGRGPGGTTPGHVLDPVAGPARPGQAPARLRSPPAGGGPGPPLVEAGAGHCQPHCRGDGRGHGHAHRCGRDRGVREVRQPWLVHAGDPLPVRGARGGGCRALHWHVDPLGAEVAAGAGASH